jgi:hypothetical protein
LCCKRSAHSSNGFVRVELVRRTCGRAMRSDCQQQQLL